MYDDVSSDDVNKCNDLFLDASKSYFDEVAKARLLIKKNMVWQRTQNTPRAVLAAPLRIRLVVCIL